MKQTAGQMLVLLRNIVYIFLAMITEKGLLEDPHWLSLCAFVVHVDWPSGSFKGRGCHNDEVVG